LIDNDDKLTKLFKSDIDLSNKSINKADNDNNRIDTKVLASLAISYYASCVNAALT